MKKKEGDCVADEKQDNKTKPVNSPKPPAEAKPIPSESPKINWNDFRRHKQSKSFKQITFNFAMYF